MKILFVYDLEDSRCENPFVRTLVQALRNEGAVVTCSVSEFWAKNTDYDVLWFQWPEAIFGFHHASRHDVDSCANCLSDWKRRGTKIAYTRHNVRPHTDSSTSMLALYDVVETSADIVFHMGRQSAFEFSRLTTSKARNVVLPHHISESICRDVSKEKARNRLNISKDSQVVLAFGSFRSHDECAMVANAFQSMEVENKKLLAPSFFSGRVFRRNPWGLMKNLVSRSRYLRYPFLGNPFRHGFPVMNDELPFYFAAADLVLIQRRYILNSGNLIMGFYFGKVVVGPKVGNVGEILAETGNPVFDPNDNDSLVKALESGIALAKTNLGLQNQKFADAHWSSTMSARRALAEISCL